MRLISSWRRRVYERHLGFPGFRDPPISVRPVELVIASQGHGGFSAADPIRGETSRVTLASITGVTITLSGAERPC